MSDNHTITPAQLTARETISTWLCQSSRAGRGHKSLAIITDLDSMAAVYQVKHNGEHICTSRHADVACAAYNGIVL